jgi:predicted nucleic acid-binding protein
LAARSACSAYDCEFVALARDLDVRLVTADRRLRGLPDTAISPEDFAA